MDAHYHYRKKPKVKKGWRRVILLFILLLLIVGGIIGYDIYRGRSRTQTGQVKTTQLTFGNNGPKKSIDEPTFTLQLPADWKETARVNNELEHSITWQATKPKEDNRFITIYVDKIPKTKSFNRLLPLEAVGNGLRHGTVSDNCAAYTAKGSFDAKQAITAKDTPAKWEEVTFLCDLPKVFDNVVGTSSLEGINTLHVTGQMAGTHDYFFLYTDHNVRPNYEIFTQLLESFKAK